MKQPKIELPVRIVLLYLLFGVLWILISDQVLLLIIPHDEMVTTYQTLKGWFFVLISGLLLYTLLSLDLAGQKQAEEHIQYQARLLDNVSDAIIATDMETRITSWNAAATKIYGWQPDEVLGKPLKEFLQTEYEDGQSEEQAFQRFLSQGLWEGEVIQNRSDGEKLAIHASVNLVRDHSGKPHAMVAVYRDVTERNQVLKELRNSQALMIGIFESAMDAIISTSADQRILIFNPAAEAMFRCSQRDVIGEPLDRFIPSRYGNKHRQDFERFAETGATSRSMGNFGTIYGLRSDGEEFPIEASISKTSLPGNELYTIILRDVKERKQAEEALRASEERFRLLFENNHTAMMLIEPESGSIRNANRAAAEFYGYSIAALCGMTIHQIDTRSPGRVSAEQMGAGKQEETYFNSYHRLANNKIRFTEVHSAPMELDGETLLFLIVHDMTDRRQAEEKLRRHIGYLTGLREVDQAIASSFDVRLSLNIITSRAVPLLNVDAAAILLLDPIMNCLEYAAAYGFRKNMLHTGTIRLGESYSGRAVTERCMIHIRDLANEISGQFRHPFLQEEKIVSYYGIPLIVKGKVVGVMEVFHRTLMERNQEWFDFLNSLAGQAAIAIDNARLWEQVQRHARDLELRVAERTAALNRTNTELEHANRAKDEFLANMSHELRTPLNSILGLAESLLEQRRDPLTEYQQRSLEIISSSGQHLLELINDILDLSKIEAGKFDHYPQVIEVDALCRSSLAFVRNLAIRKSITVLYANEDSVLSIYADPRRLKQVLVNLLSNAVKFTPEGGEVTLRVHSDSQQDRIQFSVIDNGIGIAPQNLKRLFQPFVQVDSKLNRQFEGTGLGLALVQKLTDLHGGSMEVESEVGVGSCFTVNIPWQREDALSVKILEPAGAPVSMSDELQDSEKQRLEQRIVLLAEDNVTNTMTIAEYLESYGYTIVKAHDGLEAIEKAEANNPDIILMDIQMPVMDGMESIRRLRGNPRFARTPIIAITALAMPGDREQCIQAGATEYLSKPINLKMLKKMIMKQTRQQTEP